jgi:hypothetical protein
MKGTENWEACDLISHEEHGERGEDEGYGEQAGLMLISREVHGEHEEDEGYGELGGLI